MKALRVLTLLTAWLLVTHSSSRAVETVLRYPQPLDVPLNTICWSGTQFVAGGDHGVILTSPDGTTWQVRSSPGNRKWLSSVAGSGKVVLGGDEGTVAVSSDGTNWAAVTIPGTNAPLHNAHHRDGTFLFTSEWTGATWTSGDGSNWTLWQAPAPEHNRLYGMASGPAGVVCLSGKSLSAGETQKLLSFSESGWVAGNTNLTVQHRYLVWTGVRYVAVGPGGIAATSADGITWTPRATGITNDFKAVIWTGSQVVAVGKAGAIITSPNGVTWTVQTSGTQRDLWSVAWSGTTLVAVGSGGIVLTSPDGSSWTARKAASDAILPVGVGWIGSLGLAVGSTGGTLHSTDGIQWTRTAATSGPQSNIFRLASSGGRIVAATQTGLWSAPPDGSAWTSSGMSASGVVWDGQRFVAAGLSLDYPGGPCSEYVATSTDGLTWNPSRPACPYSGNDGYAWGHLVFTGQRYVKMATFGSAFLSSSANLTTWQASTGFNGNWPDWILWTGDKLFGISRGGAVWTSPTGEAWTLVTTAPTNPYVGLYDAVCTGSRLLAVGGGVLDGTASGGWVKLSDISGKSIAWSGTRALVATGDAIYSIEGILPGPPTWEGWLAQHFPGVVDPAVIGAQADPDGDGQGNLVEYASGADPTNRASVALIAVTPPSAGSGARFEWVEDTSRNVNVTPQTSADLDAWDDVTGTLAGGSSGGIVTMRYTAPVQSRLYFRLRVSLP